MVDSDANFAEGAEAGSRAEAEAILFRSFSGAMASANLLVPAFIPASAETALASLPSNSLMPLILTTFFLSLPPSLVPSSPRGRSSSPLLLDRALVLRSSLPLPLPAPLPLIPPLLPPPLNDLPDVEVVVAPESPPTDAVTTAGLPLDVDAPPRSLVLVVPVVELAELDASPDSSLPVEEDDCPPAADELPESDPEPEVLALVVTAKRGRLFEAEAGAGAAGAEAVLAAAALTGWSTSILLVESTSGLMTGNACSEDASPSAAAFDASSP